MGHKKIIDDDVLLGMIREGKRQNEIAKSFGVSAVAICKRLKRLLPQPDLDKYNLTDQQKRFVAEKVKVKQIRRQHWQAMKLVLCNLRKLSVQI